MSHWATINLSLKPPAIQRTELSFRLSDATKPRSAGRWGRRCALYSWTKAGYHRMSLMSLSLVQLLRDRQLVSLEEHLSALMQKHIPEEQQEGFVFHTKDIWSGAGRVFKDRNRWPLAKRLDILHDLVRVPRELELPIVFYSRKGSRSFRRSRSRDDKPTGAECRLTRHDFHRLHSSDRGTLFGLSSSHDGSSRQAGRWAVRLAENLVEGQATKIVLVCSAALTLNFVSQKIVGISTAHCLYQAWGA